ncbi:MAG: hypothetical protein KGI57_01960 [Hyphomicrobiales bacterium]|nr:hypothetical protein [Hyphomicrobiales bacterium]MDE2016452.1 hypothetical protein [Hyphomicrobiales bacterium]
MRSFGVGVFAGIAACAVVAPACAATVKIVDVKLRLYFEDTGEWSPDVSRMKGPWTNVARGRGVFRRPATTVLIDATFGGPKDGAPKYATAEVEISRMTPMGQPALTREALQAFRFGPDGLVHKAILLQSATCQPLTVRVSSGRVAKTLTIPFRCTPPKPNR